MAGRFTPGRWLSGGHLGPSVSALVDGQLDTETAERAWQHVMTCPTCRRQVEREGWMKRRLAELSGQPTVDPPVQLLGSLYELDPFDEQSERKTREAWAAVERIEARGRGRRRAGLAVVGAGSVSVAVLGLSTLTGSTLGIGGAPAGPPTSSLTRPTPTAHPASTAPTRARPSESASGWHGPFPSWVQPSTPSDSALPVSAGTAP
jgi:anti-sigma factor RsiW